MEGRIVRSILLLGTARAESTRVTNKMLRPFGDTTLFDLYLRRLQALQETGVFSAAGVAVCSAERGLYTKAKASRVPVIKRSFQSVQKGIQRRADELHFLASRDEEYVCYVNACLPFFPVETMARAVRVFRSKSSLTSVAPVQIAHNWFWNGEGMPVNNRDPHCLSTQGCPPLRATVHAFFVYPRERMLRESVRWRFGPGDPFLFDVGDINQGLLDVDTEEDFRLCEIVYRARLGDEKCNARS